MSTRQLSLILAFLVCSKAQANVGLISAKVGSWSFTTENVTSSSQSSSGMGAWSFEVGVGVSSHWMLLGGYNFLFSDFYEGRSGSGFDLGTRYYFLTSTGTTYLENDHSYIKIRETFRPYLGLFLRQRTFNLSLSKTYIGPGLCAGLDYQITDSFILSGEFRYDSLQGSDDAIATQTNLLIGASFEF